ncbi:MAG: glycogen/starch synthase [Desulfobacterales bacterium]
MSNYIPQPRILFVSPEAAFMPEGAEYRPNYTSAHTGCFGDFPAELICDLYHLGVDVHVAQPDYRRIFSNLARNEQTNSGIKLPIDLVQLAEDRTFFYSKPIDSNSEWENIKISLAFQREVINQIIPWIQPDLIHCHDWMTGLIPAAAKKIGVPCLFTVQKFDTAGCLLSCIEDIGIDAAGFWQNLFYDRYPGSYEQTRDTNPLDLLLSGILAASHVNTADFVLLPRITEGRSDFMCSSLGQLLAQKWKAGCVCEIHRPPSIGLNPTNNQKLDCSYRLKVHDAGTQKNDRAKGQSISSSDNRTAGKCYIDLYETILQRPLVASEKKKVWPINKNSGINISGVQAIPCRKTRSAKSYALTNGQISTPAMVPV